MTECWLLVITKTIKVIKFTEIDWFGIFTGENALLFNKTIHQYTNHHQILVLIPLPELGTAYITFTLYQPSFLHSIPSHNVFFHTTYPRFLDHRLLALPLATFSSTSSSHSYYICITCPYQRSLPLLDFSVANTTFKLPFLYIYNTSCCPRLRSPRSRAHY